MTCYEPIQAYLPIEGDFEGKRHLIFSPRQIYEFKRSTVQKLQHAGIFPMWKKDESFNDLFREERKFPLMYIDKKLADDYPDGLLIDVPCGKCEGCSLDYSKRWATRATNEAYLHDHYNNCSFVTLTFNEHTLNNSTFGRSLSKAFFRSWLKRLRFYVKKEYGVEFRHFSCGEYGDKKQRPHYHMIIFGFNFPDRYVFQTNQLKKTSYLTYRSPFLEKLWHLPGSSESAGYSSISDVNYRTCAYVARYVTKKNHISTYTDKEQEFLAVSRMPGLGYGYCKQFLNDIFSHGYVMLPDGIKAPIPRYYESICEKLNPELYYNYKYEKFQRLYKQMLQKFYDASNPSKLRLSQLRELQKIRSGMLIRSYENTTS